jgi:CTP synthase (UTP-ammonia lyase)
MTGDQLRIAIVGDYNPIFHPHPMTTAAIDHARKHLKLDVFAEWLPSEQLVSCPERQLAKYHGVWIAPGSPYRSMEGALNAVRTSRQTGLPLLGTCGGCQYAMIEFARNVLGIRDAQHGEHDPYASVLVIKPLSCSLVGQRMEVLIQSGTLVADVYKTGRAIEEYYCNCGLNPEYEQPLQDGGLRVVGRDTDGEPRILTLTNHPFFVATVFVPQLSSTPASPHPLVIAFLQAVEARAEDSCAFS